MILELFLYSYLITTAISLMTMPIRTYLIGKGRYGKRISTITALQVAGLCFIPYLAFCAAIYTACANFKEKMQNWVNSDPTSPTNIADPDFTPPPKKEKKTEPIKDRFEIIDL